MDKSVIKNIGKSFALFLLFFYCWIFRLIPILLFNIDVENMSAQTNVLLGAFASICLAIILFFIYKNDIKEEWKKFRNRFWDNFDVGLSYWLKGLFAMVVFNFIISNVFKAGGANNEEAVQGMISALPWMMLITSGVLAPWNEELVFRKSLKKIFRNKWFYAGVSGLLFGLAHVFSSATVWTDWLYILPYGSLGVAFAASYYDTDSVFTPIMFHMMHNIILVLVSIL